MADLEDLWIPFPDKYIKQKPGKANASYVNHGVVRQRLLDVLGPYHLDNRKRNL